MIKSTAFSLITFFALISCQSSYRTIYVVHRDVTDNPSFVVIPLNEFLYQVEYANKIEAYILRTGLKVVTRPAIKEVEEKRGISKTDVQSDQGAAAQATLTERYRTFEEIQADFIIESYADTREIKIINKKSREVLAPLELKPGRDKTGRTVSEEDQLYTLFKEMGFKVLDLPSIKK